MEPPQSSALNVWIVEDNRMLRSSLADLVDEQPDMSCGLAAATCEEMLATLERDEVPDVVLMDLGLPGLSGIEGVRHLRTRSPGSRVVILTIHEDDQRVFDAICAGAVGYLLKPSPPERIVEAIREVERGASPINASIARKVLEAFARGDVARSVTPDYGLTPRETEILELLVEGLTMKAIAGRLGVSYHTIDNHLRNIYCKLHVSSRARAVAKAVQERLV